MLFGHFSWLDSETYIPYCTNTHIEGTKSHSIPAGEAKSIQWTSARHLLTPLQCAYEWSDRLSTVLKDLNVFYCLFNKHSNWPTVITVLWKTLALGHMVIYVSSMDLMGIQAAFTSPLGWHTAEWHRLTGVILRQSRAFACSTCAMEWNGIPALECSINNALNCVMLSWLIPQSICIGNLTRLSQATGLTGYSRPHPNTWLVRSIK